MALARLQVDHQSKLVAKGPVKHCNDRPGPTAATDLASIGATTEWPQLGIFCDSEYRMAIHPASLAEFQCAVQVTLANVRRSFSPT